MCFWHPKTPVAAETAPKAALKKASETFSFAQLPLTEQAALSLVNAPVATPGYRAALTLVALALFGQDKARCFSMLNALKTPGFLSPYEKQFLEERLHGKEYKPFSYFEGATPENNYTPTLPYRVSVIASPSASEKTGYLTFYIKSSGADSPRQVVLRERQDGTYALWEEFLLSDIRAPKKDNPWA